MKGVFTIARVGGIEIKVHWSWVIILLIFTFDLAAGWYPARLPQAGTLTYWLLGLVGALMLFVSVLLHELSHSFMALARKIKVRDITLFIFGGASNIEGEPKTPGDEFLIAIVGPLTSLALAALFFVLTPLTRSVAWVSSTLEYLAYINFLLALFNLIPGFPLDGGRVLRSIVWAVTRNFDSSTRIAGVVGQLVAYGFIFFGLYESFFQGDPSGLWLAFIGWFLLNAAQQSVAGAKVRDAVKGVTVAQVMEASPAVVAPTYTIAHLLSQFILPRNLRVLPVANEGRLVGIVTLSDIKDIPQDQWGMVTASQVMTGGSELQVIHPQDRLEQAVKLLGDGDFDQLPVVDREGMLVGLLTRTHLLKWMKIREELEKSGA